MLVKLSNRIVSGLKNTPGRSGEIVKKARYWGIFNSESSPHSIRKNSCAFLIFYQGYKIPLKALGMFVP